MSGDTSGAGGSGDTALNYWLAATAGSFCYYPQPSVLSEPRNSCPTVGFEPQQVSLVEQMLFLPIQPRTTALSHPRPAAPVPSSSSGSHDNEVSYGNQTPADGSQAHTSFPTAGCTFHLGAVSFLPHNLMCLVRTHIRWPKR